MPVADSSAASVETQLRAACLELERWLSSGKTSSAEQLLALYPVLADDPDSALELIFAEFTLRRQRGDQTPREEWYRRFPNWRDRLERLFHVYELIGAEASLATVTAEDTVGDRGQETGDRSQGPGARGQNRQIGNYEVIEEIARGGMGVVYKARHVGLNRIVALKLILAGEHAGAEHRARFCREAEAAARLQHPSIVQIFEIGHAGNLPFLAMEYVAGPRLDQLLSQRRREGSAGLPPRQAAELVEALARAIQHAHEHGVVHRDLKPANILLSVVSSPSSVDKAKQLTTDHGQLTIAKITDFGLAKTLNESPAETRTGMLLGTPSYMAPEQAAGRPAEIGPGTDIFALGIMLYELLTGNLPFQGSSVEQTLQHVCGVEPIAPRQLLRSVPRDLETICLKCLQKEPAKRYVSAEALAEDLRRFLRDEPIRARPVGRSERAVRWCRRNPLVAALTGGIGLLLLGGTVVAATLAVWALREKSRASQHALQASTSAQQERAARDLAEYRFSQAENAVGGYLDDIEKNDRLKEADFFDVRKQLLTSAISFYEEFVRAKPADAALEAKRGRAYYRLASVRKSLGELEQAVADYRRGQSVFQKLAVEFPAQPEYRQRLATGHDGLGVLLTELEKYEEAKVEHEQGQQLWRRLAIDFPAVADHRYQLAQSQSYLGHLFIEMRKFPEAEAVFSDAFTRQENLAAEYPTVSEYRLAHVVGHSNRGRALHHLRKWSEAEGEYRQAIVLLRRLAAELPASAEFDRQLANCHNNLGAVLSGLSRFEETADEHRAAMALSKSLVARFATVPRYRDMLARSHYNLGVNLTRRKNLVDAEDEYRKAVTLRQQLASDYPSMPDYHRSLALTRHNLAALLEQKKEPEQAIAEYRQALISRAHLVEHFPARTEYRSGLSKTLNSLAGLLRVNGELQEARQLYSQAIENQLALLQAGREEPDYLGYLQESYYGQAYTTMGQRDHRATAAAADEMSRVPTGAALDAYRAARLLGYCVPLAEQDAELTDQTRQALAQSYADQAMEHLREAIHRGYKNAKQFKTSDALAPLHQRPDFQQLIRELESR